MRARSAATLLLLLTALAAQVVRAAPPPRVPSAAGDAAPPRRAGPEEEQRRRATELALVIATRLEEQERLDRQPDAAAEALFLSAERMREAAERVALEEYRGPGDREAWLTRHYPHEYVGPPELFAPPSFRSAGIVARPVPLRATVAAR